MFSFLCSVCPSHNVFQQGMEPCIDIVWCFVVAHILAAMKFEEFADCRVYGEFCSENQHCFVRPFFERSELAAVLLGDSEEFGDSEDPIRVASEWV